MPAWKPRSGASWSTSSSVRAVEDGAAALATVAEATAEVAGAAAGVDAATGAAATVDAPAEACASRLFERAWRVVDTAGQPLPGLKEVRREIRVSGQRAHPTRF
jgi:hypothetical protein